MLYSLFIFTCVTCLSCISCFLLHEFAKINSLCNIWNFLGVSLIHSTIQTVFLFPIVLFHSPLLMSWSEIYNFKLGIYKINVYTCHIIFLFYICLEFSYFAKKLRKSEQIHHVLNFLAISFSLIFGISYVSAIGLFSEFSTVFLNLRYLKQENNMINYMFVASFLSTRIFMNGYITILALANMKIIMSTFMLSNLLLNLFWLFRIIIKMIKK